MLAVYGKYDGKVVRLLQPVQASQGAEVIITFLGEAPEPWIQRLAANRKPCSLAEVQELLATLKPPLAKTVIGEREGP